MQEYVNLLKQFNPVKTYKIGTYVDVMDANNSWRVGKIEEINKEEICKFVFDGWSRYWDEVKN
jgi:hypothetical protein